MDNFFVFLQSRTCDLQFCESFVMRKQFQVMSEHDLIQFLNLGDRDLT